VARKKKVIAPPEHCDSVRAYEMSPWWRIKSKALREPKDTVCAICGKAEWVWQPRIKKWKCRKFHTHHIRYTSAPYEKPEDFMILCYTCHTEAHLMLRYQNICEMFQRMADIVKEYFFYEGIDTFRPW